MLDNSNIVNTTIGQRIKQRRLMLNMSQEELAFKLGYKSRSSVNKIEMGDRSLTQSKIKAIADALDTTPSYIMGWDDELADTSPISAESFSQEDMQLLEIIKKMTPEQKQAFLALFQGKG